MRLTIGVVRPLSARPVAGMDQPATSAPAARSTRLRNNAAIAIAGAQVRIDMEIPANSIATVGAPSGWSCQRLGDASFLCTAGKPIPAGATLSFTVDVRRGSVSPAPTSSA